MVWKLAWRNVWRRRRRTVITSLSVAIGLWATLIFTGMGNYNWNNMVDSGVRLGLGHITVEPKGYLESPSLNRRIRNSETLRAEVARAPGVRNAIVRIMGEGMVATASKSVGSALIGIDPDREAPEYNFFLKSLKGGKLFGPGEGGAVIGSGMAERLNLKLGKKLIYTCTDVNGEIVSDMARVTGIFHTGASEIDASTVLLPINRLRATLHYSPDEATFVAVFLDDQRHTEKMLPKIAAIAGDPDSEVWPWQKTQPEISGSISLDRASHLFFQFFIGLLAAAGILDTILMSVMERKHEFGVMLAVGTSPGTLFRTVLAESVFIGFFGLALGAVINLPFYLFLSRKGLDLTYLLPQGFDYANVPFEPIMKVLFYPENVAMIVLALFSLTLLAGLYPAWRASRIPPIESIRLH